MKRRRLWVQLSCLGALACGSVSGSDPSLWTRSQDVAGADYDFSAPNGGGQPDGAGGGYVQQGTGGFFGGTAGSNGAGGQSVGAGGAYVYGAGGQIVASAGGAFAAGGASGSGGAPGTNSGTCTFTFMVTTVTAHGTYAPRNVGAIWIDDGSGKFVKTLQEWGVARIGNATAWETASGGNVVDAVTGATLPNHGPHTATWNCTDLSGNPVPDGNYSVNVTFAESDAFPFFGPAPIQTAVTFVKSASPLNVTPPDAGNFTAMHLTLQ